MKDYKVGDEIEIKLRVKVVNDEPKSSFGSGAFLEVETITPGIWETIYETIIIEQDAKDRIISNEN